MIIIGKPKEPFWEVLKSLVLPSKTSVCGTNAIKVNNTMSFETKSTLDIFKSYCSTLAENLREKTPNLSQQIYFLLFNTIL